MFHRIDDMYTLSGPRLCTLAERLAAYDGVMRARVAAAVAEEEGHQPGPVRAAPARPGVRSEVYVPDAVTAQSVALDPVLSSLFSIGTPT